MKKVTIYTLADKRPDFIPVQYESFKKFLKDDYEYIVINNAIGSKKRKNLIKKTCETLGIKQIEVKKDKRFKTIGKQKVFSMFGFYVNPNVAAAYPIKWIWEKFCSDNTDRLAVLIDSDMFLCKEVSFNEELGESDASLILQYRGLEDIENPKVAYPWNGICIFNIEKIPNLKDLNWDCGVIKSAFLNGYSVDVGGYGHFWLQENKIKIKNISEYAIHNYKILSENKIWLEAVINGNFHYSFEYDKNTKQTFNLFYFKNGAWQKFAEQKILPNFPADFMNTLKEKTVRYFEKYVLEKKTYPDPTFLGIIEFETYDNSSEAFIIHNKAGSGYMGFDDKYGKQKLDFIEKTLGFDVLSIRNLRKSLGIEEIFEPFKFIKQYKRYIKVTLRKMKKINLKSKIKSLIKKVFYALTGRNKNEITKKQIKNLLSKDDAVIFEIGSADGQDTLKFLNLFKNPNFKIYGFEPEPKNIKLIKEKINDSRFYLFKGVISDTNGEISFNRSSTGNPEDLSLSGSIMQPKNHLKEWDWIHFDEKITVPSITLDTFCKDKNIDVIDFVWCDVQGAEEKVILGGKETFANKVRYLYTEYSNNELYAGQPTLAKILELLPDFEIVKDFKTDVLLKNKKI